MALVAPPDARAAAYRAYVSAADLDEALRALAADAFGTAGRYDRSRLARLDGARRPRVARGARRAADGVVEAWTLISPHPDLDLQRLERGTLLVVLRRP